MGKWEARVSETEGTQLWKRISSASSAFSFSTNSGPDGEGGKRGGEEGTRRIGRV